MSSMQMFEQILERRGLAAATAYAHAAKLYPAQLRAERLQTQAEREAQSAPVVLETLKKLGKTERDRLSGAKKRQEDNRRARQLQNQMRCRNSGGGKKK